MSTNAKNPNVIITPVFRVAYPKVFKPESYKGGKPQYSMTMIFDKDTDLTELKTAIVKLAKEKFPDIKNLKALSPIKDGNTDKISEKTGEVPKMYVDKIVVNTSNKIRRPDILDAKKKPLLEEADFYAGCYARASVTLFAYSNIKTGISVILNNIQKVRDGEPLVGVVTNAEDDFDVINTANDDDIQPDESAYADLV